MNAFNGPAMAADPIVRPGLAVLFMDDFTRCGVNGLHHHRENRGWLRRLLAPGLAAAGCTGQDWAHDGCHADVAAFMATLGLPASPAGWAATSTVDPLPTRAATWLDDRLHGAGLVIGFELPLFLLRHLSRRGIGFIDVGIDPVRFARDLFLRIRTNRRPIEHRLQALELNEEVLWTDAALLAGHALRQHPPILDDPAASATVFFGQTAVDRALVKEGCLADPRAFVPAIAAAAAGSDVLLIRPHPCEPDHGIVEDLARLLAQAGITTRLTPANSYALLASEQVRRVVSLSSSLMTEAPFFGKPACPLVTPDIDHPSLQREVCSRWYRLDAVVVSRAFWSGRPPRLPPAPNLLRESLGITWARDLPLRPAAPPPAPLSRRRRIARAGLNLIRAVVS